jgi:uncharacterized Zn finger protein (UPF0148 family)
VQGRVVSKNTAAKSDLAWATAMGLSVAEFRQRFKPWMVRGSRTDAGEALPPIGLRVVNSKPNKDRRARVIARDGYRCRYCTRPVFEGITGPQMLTIDHVVPRGRGGTNSLSNLVVACNGCNQEKAHLLASEWQEPVSLGGITPLVGSSMPTADCPDCTDGIWEEGDRRSCPTCEGSGQLTAERAIKLFLEARDRARNERRKRAEAQAEANRLKAIVEDEMGWGSTRRDLAATVKSMAATIKQLSDAILRDKVRIASLGGGDLERLIPNPKQRERALSLVHPRHGAVS